jgi:hypothetical protein
MDANKILQQYVLIKPNTYSINGHFDTPLQSLENVQIINKSDMTNGKLTNNYQFYHQQQPVGEKSDGKKPRHEFCIEDISELWLDMSSSLQFSVFISAGDAHEESTSNTV